MLNGSGSQNVAYMPTAMHVYAPTTRLLSRSIHAIGPPGNSKQRGYYDYHNNLFALKVHRPVFTDNGTSRLNSIKDSLVPLCCIQQDSTKD